MSTSSITQEDAEEFTQSLGQIMAGGWRQIALAERMGVPSALGMDTREWVEQRLGGYIRLSIPERREAVRELIEDEGMSTREAAAVLGVGKDTVARDMAVSNATAMQLDPIPIPPVAVAYEPPTPIRDEPDIDALIEQADDGKIAAARMRRAWATAAYQVRSNLLPLQPEPLAKSLDSTEYEAALRLTSDLIDWLRALEAACPKRLELVR